MHFSTKLFIFFLFILLGFAFKASFAYAADRYWVGGCGDATWACTSPATNWGTASTTLDNASVPGSSDDVFFTSATSAPSTLSADITINSLDMTGYVGTLTMNNGVDISIDGVNVNFKLSAGMTLTLVSPTNSSFVFTSTSGTVQITTAGKTMPNLFLNGSGGTFQLQDTFTSSGSSVTRSAGTFDANGQTVVMTATTVSFFGSFNGVNSFANLTRTGTAATTNVFNINNNIVVTGTLTINGNSSVNRMLVQTTTLGTNWTITAATVSVSNTDFRDITGAGAGDWDLSAITGLSGDALGNSGITFTTADIMYWTGDTGDWSVANQWCLSSGGCSDNAGNGRVPLPQDDVIFDNGSFSAGSQTASLDMPRLGRNIDFSGYGEGQTPTISRAVTITMYGSLTLNSGMNFNNWAMIFEGRDVGMPVGGWTITSAGKTFSLTTTINGFGGTYTLQDAGIFTGSGFRIDAGTFNTNDNNLTVATLILTNLASITVNLGASTVLVTGTGSVWYFQSLPTLNAGTSNITLSNTTVTAKTFAGAGKTYNNVTFSGDNITVTGSNTFNIFALDALNTNGVLLTTGTTQTVADFTSNGDGSNKPKLRSTTTTNATIAKSGGGTICEDYIDVDYITGTPADTWYMGANSTDGTHNLNLTFTGCPAEPTINRGVNIQNSKIEIKGGKVLIQPQ